jgi:Ni/Co efflux regulator RcnB
MSPACLRTLCLTLVLGASLPAAVAGKPQWVEDGHHKKEKSHRGCHDDERRSGCGRDGGPRADAQAGGVSVQIQIGGYFGEAQRRAARDYYEPRWRAGKCPPGLAKKGNGCQPPGQAKQWQRGEPLPRDVVVYNVPTSVQVKLGTPPAGHKFVRVATDILLIAVGTGMVIDAIEDLGQL